MLSIGEFSAICKVSTQTLRYYAKIGLLLPSEINPKSGYRYYAIKQLETMLFINRLKSYHFSLEDIKAILDAPDEENDRLYQHLRNKEEELQFQQQEIEKTIERIQQDLQVVKQGDSIMDYLDHIDIQLVEVPMMFIVSIRKMVQPYDLKDEYQKCFTQVIQKIQAQNLTMIAPPMVMFHNEEVGTMGFDVEFAIPVQERATGTRDFYPGLSVKSVLHGPYLNLSSIYVKLIEWAEENGYQSSNALYEVYCNDPSMVSEAELVTEVYYPIRKDGLHR